MCRRSDWRYGPCAPPVSGPSSQFNPSQRRSSMAEASASLVERAKSVSSTRSTNVAPAPRAISQLKSAVRALPTWIWPVGLGANLRRMLDEGDGVNRDRFAGADRVDAFVRLSLDADLLHIDSERARHARAHRVDVRCELRPLRDHDDVDVCDRVTGGTDDLDRSLQQLDAVRVLPGGISVGKVTA